MELEELYKRFEALPESIQDALMAPETANFVYEIGKSANLTDEKISLLAELVGDIFMNISKNFDLTNEIKNTLEVDDNVAKNISTEISKVITYIQSRPIEQVVGEEEEEELEDAENEEEENTQLEPTENISILKPTFVKEEPAVSSVPIPKTEIPIQQSQPVIPQSVTETPLNQEPQSSHATPFILHQEEEIEPAKETSKAEYSIHRPEFYKPTFSEEYKRGREIESAARVELGEDVKKAEPRLERTSAEPRRIVHYSEFRTPISPFEGTAPTEPRNETAKEKPAARIHPNNVIDLKDLPLE